MKVETEIFTSEDSLLTLEFFVQGLDFETLEQIQKDILVRLSQRLPTGGKAKMEGAKMEGAKMEGAKMEGAKMEGAKMEGAKMEGAKMEGARVEKAKERIEKWEW